jgi:hypothetical protein
MSEKKEVEVTRAKAQEGSGSLCILMLIQKSFTSCFMSTRSIAT